MSGRSRFAIETGAVGRHAGPRRGHAIISMCCVRLERREGVLRVTARDYFTDRQEEEELDRMQFVSIAE